jgi:hypothetical protein
VSTWKVADAHFLRDPLLEVFLKENPDNRIVFTEYNFIESYKGNAVTNMARSIRILSNFPQQVVVLKGARDLVRDQSMRILRRDELLDQSQTDEFPRFCKRVLRTAQDDSAYVAQIEEHGRAATGQLERIKGDSGKVAEGIILYSKALDPQFCKSLRKGEYPDGAASVILRNALEIAGFYFKDHPSVNRIPPYNELFHTFLFRSALMGFLLALKWISAGGIESILPERLTNDIVDMTQAVYATYFDGFLTHEKKWIDLYEEGVVAINALVEP